MSIEELNETMERMGNDLLMLVASTRNLSSTYQKLLKILADLFNLKTGEEKIREPMGMTDRIILRVFDSDGNVKQEYDSGWSSNGITNAGMAEVAGLILTDVGGTAFDYIAIGTGTTAFDPSQTALVNEIKRKAATGTRVTTIVTNDTAQLVTTFSSADGLTGTSAVTESGVFNASSGGTMLCLPPGTLILGDNKPIEEYAVGDHALYGGRVLETFERFYDGDLVAIRPFGLPEVELTPEHPVLTVPAKIVSKHEGKWIEFGEPVFKDAKDVRPSPVLKYGGHEQITRGDFLVAPRHFADVDVNELDLRPFLKNGSNPGSAKRLSIPLNKDTAWLMGLYVADGSRHSIDGDFVIALGENNKEAIQRAMRIAEELGYGCDVIDHRPYGEKALQLVITSSLLGRALKSWCGDGRLEKKVPDFILRHRDERIVKAFLEGVIAGDGYIHNQGRRGTDIEIKTVSRTLALQLHMIATRLGYYARIYEYPAIDDRVIKGRHVSFKNLYRVDIRTPSRGNGRIRFTNNYALIPVETVERRHYRGYVYNLETEKHIYLANNIIVHNCRQTFSALNINWDAGDTLQVTWKVQVKQAT